MDSEYNADKYYNEKGNRKKLNHIIPKVYYKQWIGKNNINLKIETKDGDIVYKNIDKYNKEKYAFVIRFGDTFLPEIVKENIKNIINSNGFRFFCDDIEHIDLEEISDKFYSFGKWSVTNANGQKIKEKTFETKISEANCYGIEIGLDKNFENNYLLLIEDINKLFCNSKKELLDGQLLFERILKNYLCFYLRSDAWHDSANKILNLIICGLDIKTLNNKNANINKIKEKLIIDLKKKYLWELLYEYDKFKIDFNSIYNDFKNKNLIVYRNLTKQKFVTSKMPVCNIQGMGSVFMMSPIYLAKPVDDVSVIENRVYFRDIVDLDCIKSINIAIKNKAKEIVLYN